MAQYMKSETDQEMWKRQVSNASTQLPCSPPISRMVSPESDRDVDCQGSDKVSQKQVGAAVRLLASRIIDSLYQFCVHMSFFVCVAAVAVPWAVLWPWALLLLPLVYLCLTDGGRTEDCEKEDYMQKKSKTAQSSPDPAFALSSGVLVYTVGFALLAVLAIVVMLLPAAIVFCLKD